MKLDWRGDQFRRELMGRLTRNLKPAGQVVQAEMKDLIHVQGPPPSSAWNPPHVDSGDLIKSIDIAPVSGDFAVYIGSTLDYAVYLEEGTPTMEPRPFMVRALVQAGEDAARELLNV
jgi:hypothetical protein